MGHGSCHIEKLPDDVLLCILQSLPLVDAVATRPLSRRWKNLSDKSCSQRVNLCFDLHNLFAVSMTVLADQNIYYRKNLKLCCSGYILGMSTETIEDFIKGVDMIVRCRRGEQHVPGVKSLEIKFPLRAKHSGHIDHWMSSLLTSSTIKQLSLVLRVFTDKPCLPYSYTHFDLYKFPFELLLPHKSLEYLQLEFVSVKLPQNFGGFPALRTLKLNKADFTQEDLHKFLTNCPLLELFKIKDCQYLISLEISSPLPHLMVLIIEDCFRLTRLDLRVENLSIFEYNTPTFFDHLMLRGCHNLTKVAARGLRDIDEDDFRPLSEVFPFLTTLYAVTYLVDLNILLRGNIFAHLKFLAIFLTIEDGDRYLHFLPTSLNVVAPMLEELELHVCYHTTEKCFKTNNEMIDGEPHNHLKRVAFTGFKGVTGDTMLAKYFLKKARRLQVMTIDPNRKHYVDFGVRISINPPRKADKQCRKAYRFLCKEVPQGAKVILVDKW